MPKEIDFPGEVKIGDFYEDCSFHPCLCIYRDDTDLLSGISLVDGSERLCSARHCGVRILTLDEAVVWKRSGPQDVDTNTINMNRWWK